MRDYVPPIREGQVLQRFEWKCREWKEELWIIVSVSLFWFCMPLFAFFGDDWLYEFLLGVEGVLFLWESMQKCENTWQKMETSAKVVVVVVAQWNLQWIHEQRRTIIPPRRRNTSATTPKWNLFVEFIVVKSNDRKVFLFFTNMTDETSCHYQLKGTANQCPDDRERKEGLISIRSDFSPRPPLSFHLYRFCLDRRTATMTTVRSGVRKK